MLNLTEAELLTVKQILKKHVPNAKVFVFGSRTRGKVKPHSDLDIAKRITERIKSMEADIKDATDKVDVIATSTPAVTTTTDATNTTPVLMKTSDIKDMKDRLKKAQDALDEAKVLLDKKDFDGSLKKIQESKDIMGGVIDETPIDTTTSTIPVATSTPSVAK